MEEGIALSVTYGISDLLEWDVYCHWNVVKKLGGGIGDKVPVVVVPPPTPPLPTNASQRLLEAQHETSKPILFEKAVAEAFQALGFVTEHVGGSGEADVVATALLGDETFKVIIDAKTCQTGVAKSSINYDPIRGHQEQHEADYAVVVAPSFASGNTVQHAQMRSIGLLRTEQLVSLVEEAQRAGLALSDLKHILGQKGLISFDLHAQVATRADLVAAAKAVLAIYESHQRKDDKSAAVDPSAAFWLAKGQGQKFSEHQVRQAIDFLANPLVGILSQRDNGYVLTLPSEVAHVRVRSVGEELRIAPATL